MESNYYEGAENDLQRHSSGENGLKQVPTNVTMSAELFEKLYLAPKTEVAGDLRKRFGNPLAFAVVGFCIGLGPISCQLMGWRGTTGGGIATGSVSIWFGGFMLIVGGFMEFILGNTFPAVVFVSYGCHFLTYATTFIPWFANLSTFTPDGTTTDSPEFLNAFAFYLLFMGVLTFIYLICSIRTNVVFVFVFITVLTGFLLSAASLWYGAEGNAEAAEKCQKAAGGVFFTTTFAGFYFLLVLMLAVMDLPSPPVGDLSTVIKGVSERKKL